MPLVLDAPEQVTIASVRITNSGSVCFEQEKIAEVDPTGSIYSSLKDALYGLLKVHVGAGTVE